MAYHLVQQPTSHIIFGRLISYPQPRIGIKNQVEILLAYLDVY